MPLTLITGPANAGKTGEVFSRLESAVSQRRSAALLLPTGPDVRRARREVAARCPVGVDVAQADRYLATRWALYGDGRRLVGRVTRGILMARAAERTDAGAHGEGVRRALEAVVRLSSGTDATDGVEEDLGRTLAHYRALLSEAGLVEPTEAQRLLADRERDRADVIVAHRFTDLTAAQEEYLVSAALAGSDVAVSLTWEENHPGTAALDGLVERLSRRESAHVRLEGSVRYYDSPDLQELGARMFQTATPEPIPVGGGLSMLEVRGPEAEARAVVASVRRLLAEGTDPERIAVVHRDPLRALERLLGVFEEADVAVDADVPVPVRATPFGRALSRLLAFTESSASEDLSAFLRTPYSGSTAEEADRLDAEWRRRRVEGRHRLMAGVVETGNDAPVVLRAAEQAQATGDPGEAAKLWRRAFDRMLVNAVGSDAPTPAGARSLDADAHRATCEVLEELAGLGRLDVADLRTMLADVTIHQAVVERPGRVQVMGARRARSRRFDAVVLFGLDGEIFPRPGGEGLAGDAVSSLARRLGIRPSAEQGIDGERLLFYQVVTRASKRLILIRQALDEAGSGRRASTFWHEITDIFGEAPVKPFDEPASTHEARIRGLRGSGASPVRELHDPRTLAALGERETFSASELESYLACPYRWFYQRILRPREIDTAMSHREFGGLAHRVLELTYERLESTVGERRVSTTDLDRVLALADEALEEALAERPEPGDLVEVEGVRSARARVRAVLRADATSYPGYVNESVEWAFGMVDDEPHSMGDFALRGRIDRIDRAADDLIVMDYKWGGGSSHGRFQTDGLIQLPLYARVARERLGGRVVAALYRGLGSEQDRGFAIKGAVEGVWLRPRAHDWVDESQIEEVIADALARAGDAVRGIRAGRIVAEPLTPSACRYCDAGPFCGGCGR